MLTKEFIEYLSVPQLKIEILVRGGHLGVRANSFKYLRYYLWTLRDVEPNVVPVIKKKKRPTDSALPKSKPATTVSSTDTTQSVAHDTTPPSTPRDIKVFGFSKSI